MRSKGQLFSLDLVIAVALVILALGLLFRHAEVFHYMQKDSAIQSELYRIGINASNQLVSNPAIVCELRIGSLASSSLIDYLPNCLPKNPARLRNITKANLGIPDGFSCEINPNNIGTKTECKDAPLLNVENVFSIERRIVHLRSSDSNAVSKRELNNCVNKITSCVLEESVLSLKVWKS